MRFAIKTPNYYQQCSFLTWAKWQCWKLKFNTFDAARMWLRLRRLMISPRCNRCMFWATNVAPHASGTFRRCNNPIIGRSERKWSVLNPNSGVLATPLSATVDQPGEIRLVTHSHFGCVAFVPGIKYRVSTEFIDAGGTPMGPTPLLDQLRKWVNRQPKP